MASPPRRRSGGRTTGWLVVAASTAVFAVDMAWGPPRPAAAAAGGVEEDPRPERFRAAPAAYRPHVAWPWTEGSVAVESITADLESIARAGFAGAMIVPAAAAGAAPARPAGPEGDERLLSHAAAEAARLGIELSVQDASLPAWAPGERLTWRSYRFLGSGTTKIVTNLSPPPGADGPYRDVAVLASPTPPPAAEPLAATPWLPPTAWDRGRAIDLTSRMNRNGRLEWEAPLGFWHVLRIGAVPATGPPTFGPECTARFQRRLGYDPTPFLPLAAGFTDADPAIGNRFRWDMRTALVEEFLEANAAHAGGFARRLGLPVAVPMSLGMTSTPRLRSLDLADVGDVPVAMLPIDGASGPNCDSCRWASAAGHVSGRRVTAALVAAAWPGGGGTSSRGAAMQPHVHAAWCAGVNRIVLPTLPEDPAAEEWRHCLDSLARCHYLLQAGMPVIDWCQLDIDGGTDGVPTLARDGYPCDALTPRQLETRARVVDGQLTLPDGMRYRALILPPTDRITPRALKAVVAAARAGATVALTVRPAASPSLQDHPACDAEVATLAKELCGDAVPPPKGFVEAACGKGRVILLANIRELPAAVGIRPAMTFEAAGPAAVLRSTQRRTAGAEIHCIANLAPRDEAVACLFAAPVGTPELWNPDTGDVAPIPGATMVGKAVRVPVRLGPKQAVFVVVRRLPEPSGKAAP